MNYFEIGAAPSGEDGAQTTDENYRDKAMKEWSALIGQIRRQFGKEPPGTRLIVKDNKHDAAGIYYEVAFYYDNEADLGYALNVEKSLASRWDAQARKELGLD